MKRFQTHHIVDPPLVAGDKDLPDWPMMAIRDSKGRRIYET